MLVLSFAAGAGVKTDKTSESLTEFFKELDAIRTPIPETELTKAKNYITFGFPSEFETLGDLFDQFAVPEYSLERHGVHSNLRQHRTQQRAGVRLVFRVPATMMNAEHRPVGAEDRRPRAAIQGGTAVK